MRKFYLIAILFAWLSQNSYAKEGMYIPMLLEKINASEMQAMGMKITADEIYSLNHSSLKDAIVHFGGGCTAEIVSEQGLLFTNHHCGYRSIQKHSSIENDYLTDGFWAKSKAEELPNPGLTATILQSMEDVTILVLKGVKADMSQAEKAKIIKKNIQILTQEDKENTFIKTQVKAFYYGNQYILMRSKVFRDVRLVGAPPSNIGKFGGDTDNWMWPRHTGDFSIFRIYADKDNKPANFSKENKPYKPEKSLKISLKGYTEGDFTFVFGYPGRTQEYLPSYAIKQITEVINPFKIDIRRQKLDIMGEAMKSDRKIRIQYSAKYAGIANGWKKWIGENKGCDRLKTIENKQKAEKEFIEWANDKPQYRNLLGGFEATYKSLEPYEMAYQYFVEDGYYQDLIKFSKAYLDLIELAKNEKVSDEKFNQSLQNLKKGIPGFYKDYNENVEKSLMKASLSSFLKFPYQNSLKPAVLQEISEKYKGNVDKYLNKFFKKSVFTQEVKLQKFMDKANRKAIKKLEKDMLIKLTASYYDNFQNIVLPEVLKYQNILDSLMSGYMKALLEKNEGTYLFPDANSTLRVSYGAVSSSYPKDGVKYQYFTTLKGIMMKENPNIYDYVVMPKLKTLYQNKDYGNYVDKDGSMHVCFIASNHTTGGNSGSPVLNAEGHLMGLNFDRNWEGTMSDLNYDPEQCRNIILDVRYCLFIIDKFAGAHRLIQELDLVQ